jgi:phosphopantothenoylcysteine decarboxylase/phosphopantothenate--cysteine ligase
MGYAIAAAAWRRGAEVVLVAGPAHSGAPPEIETIHHVETAGEMSQAVNDAAAGAAALFMVAAVGDYRAVEPRGEKIRRSSGLDAIRVESTPDVLAGAAAAAPPDCVKVAFAVDSGSAAVESARRKLKEKGATLIVLNDPQEPGAGFDVDTNRVTIIDAAGAAEELPLMLKTELADEILDRAERFLPGD